MDNILNKNSFRGSSPSIKSEAPSLNKSRSTYTGLGLSALSKHHAEIPRSNTPQHSALQREKELKLERQFQELVKRCDRSKAQMEVIGKSLFTDRNQISPKFEKSKDFSLHPYSASAYSVGMSPPGNIVLKDFVLNRSTSHFESFQPIQRDPEPSFIREENRRSQILGKNPSFSNVHRRDEESPRKGRSILKSESDEEEHERDPRLDSAESMKELRSALQKQKRAQEGKYSALESQYEELKKNLEKFIQRVEGLEGLHKKKDEELLNLQEQLKRDSQELGLKQKVVKEFEQIKNVLQQNSEDLKDLNFEYSMQLTEQKKTLDTAEQAFTREQEMYAKDLKKVRDENKSLKREVELFRARENILIESNKNLKDDIDELKPKLESLLDISSEVGKADITKENQVKQLNQYILELAAEKKTLTKELKELEATVEMNEKKLVEISTRRREEKIQLKDEFTQDFAKKKEQISNFKREIRENEGLLNKTYEEIKLIKREIELIVEQKSGSERERDTVKASIAQLEQERKILSGNLERIKSQNKELIVAGETEAKKAQEWTSENNKLNTSLKIVQGKVDSKEKEIKGYEDRITAMRLEKGDLLRINNQVKDEIAKIQNRIHGSTADKKGEVSEAEKKIDTMANDLKKVRSENETANKILATLRADLHALKEEKEEEESAFMQLMQENRNLKENIAQRQADLEEALQQKREKEEKKLREMQERARVGEKIRVLNEIQDKIGKYRLTRKRSESP